MKLSQMNTEELANALCRLAGPFCRIARDERVVAAMAETEKRGTARERLFGTAEKLFPLLLQEHREDAAEILGVLTGKEKEKILRQSALETLRDIRECADGELTDFFLSAGRTRKTGFCRRFTGTARPGEFRSWRHFWKKKNEKQHGGGTLPKE